MGGYGLRVVEVNACHCGGGERTFLGSPRKVPKEGDIGEALSVALPRAKAALSYVPLPAALNWLVPR